MAKDLYMNTSFKGNDITRVLLRKIDIGGMRAGTISIFRNQRSITDPLQYINKDSERKYRIYNPALKPNFKDTYSENLKNILDKRQSRELEQ